MGNPLFKVIEVIVPLQGLIPDRVWNHWEMQDKLTHRYPFYGYLVEESRTEETDRELLKLFEENGASDTLIARYLTSTKEYQEALIKWIRSLPTS